MRKLVLLALVIGVFLCSTGLEVLAGLGSTATYNAVAEEGCKISGFIKPSFNIPNESNTDVNQGSRVEVVGTELWGETDAAGYFEICGVRKKMEGYQLKISKTCYLSRNIEDVTVDGDVKISESSYPIDIWAGDIGVQDNSINMVDVMEAAKVFNSTRGSSKYIEDYDFNLDGAVNMADIQIIAKSFNKTPRDYGKHVSPVPTHTPVPTANTPAPTSTPVQKKITGMLVWNDFEGGFFGLMASDGKNYDLGEGLPGMAAYMGSLIEVTGYVSPTQYSFHMWGTIFVPESFKRLF